MLAHTPVRARAAAHASGASRARGAEGSAQPAAWAAEASSLHSGGGEVLLQHLHLLLEAAVRARLGRPAGRGQTDEGTGCKG